MTCASTATASVATAAASLEDAAAAAAAAALVSTTVVSTAETTSTAPTISCTSRRTHEFGGPSGAYEPSSRTWRERSSSIS